MRQKTIGVLAILVAALMWALSPIAIKLSYRSTDFAQSFAVIMGTIAVVGGLYACIAKASFKRNAGELQWLLFTAIIGTILAEGLYLYALTTTPVLNATLIGHLQPVFLILFGFLFLRTDVLSRVDYTGIGLMLFAALLVTARTFDNLLLFRLGTFGDLLVLVATIAWAASGIVARKFLMRMNVGVLVAYRFAIAAAVGIAYLLLFRSFAFSGYQVIAGIIGGIGYILYYEALKRLKAAQAGALELAAPLFAAVLGFVVLGETVSPLQIAGVLLLCVGVYFLSKHEI